MLFIFWKQFVSRLAGRKSQADREARMDTVILGKEQKNQVVEDTDLGARGSAVIRAGHILMDVKFLTHALHILEAVCFTTRGKKRSSRS